MDRFKHKKRCFIGFRKLIQISYRKLQIYGNWLLIFGIKMSDSGAFGLLLFTYLGIPLYNN